MYIIDTFDRIISFIEKSIQLIHKHYEYILFYAFVSSSIFIVERRISIIIIRIN